MSLLSRTDKSLLSQWWWTIDRPVLAALFLLMTIGVFLVAAASPPVADRLGLNSFYFTVRHIIFLFPAILVLLVSSFLTARQIWRISLLALLVAFAALILVLMTGDEIKGAQRWLSVLGFSVQPSEFAKPVFLIVTAWLISSNYKSTHRNKSAFNYGMSGVIYMFLLVLVTLQPDIGMAFVITCSFAAQIFLAGLPLRWLCVFLGFILAGILLAYFSLDHVQSRFDRFLSPEQGDTYQIEKSLEAFRHGGLTGTGPGQGSVKMHLPDSHADFIFSVAGEELGAFFVLCLIGLYGFIILRALGKVMESDDMFCILAVGGLLIQMALQTFIHMGSALNLLPTKGMTLPFVSYGGSSLIAMAFTMGVVLSLTRRYGKNPYKTRHLQSNMPG